MKKTITPFLALLAFYVMSSPLTLFAQNLKHCGTDEAMRQSLAEHPEYRQAVQDLEIYTQSLQFANVPQSSTIYTVPVVFHIIHNYGPENISDAQVLDAINVMNEDYSKTNADTAQTVAEFQGIAANVGFQFRLATKDPNGNCTNGIDRIASLATNVGNDAQTKLNDWPYNKYLNIWVCKKIGSGAAAYSYYPGGTQHAYDGIICEYDYVGSIETSDNGKRHTLSHEAGHYFNLKHTWGDSNSPGVTCGDDGVSDTPITKGWTNCELVNNKICDVTIAENVQNFMDYSYCNTMFTNGQKSRMVTAITASFSSRNNLWTPSNLTATGALASPAPVCTPVADFTATSSMVCAGTPINFTDKSFNATPTSWVWTFPGGSPASSTIANPVVTYPAPGTYNVFMKAINSAGNDTLTKVSYISVVDPSQTIATPTKEGFESAAYPNSNWLILNPDGGPAWKKTTSAFSTGSASLMVTNFTVGVNGQVETLISPLFNFTTSSVHKLTFKLSYAQQNSSSSDMLQVWMSNDCGETWNLRYNKSGVNLSTAGIKTSSFTPTTSSQWRLETVSITPYTSSPNVRIKFEFTSCGDGNNIFIDDIGINGEVGIDENDMEAGFSADVYPNPFKNETMLNISTDKKEKVSYVISDLLGRQLYQSEEQALEPGDHIIPVSFSGPSGIYFLNVRAGQLSLTKKIILEN